MNLIEIGNYPDTMSAEIDKTKLESEGIKCMTKDSYNADGTGLSGMFGGVKLMVNEEDVEKAKKCLVFLK